MSQCARILNTFLDTELLSIFSREKFKFSQSISPRGKAEIVAGLETDDPWVIEVKIWDTEKGCRENRLRDGLRQIAEYATKYGKDKGYVVAFTLDQQPLSFTIDLHQDK